ncbi:hypothetical protein, partial [Pseudomonas sp.]|uniref:hypothetical protein n=1 Tax=Pseudomonas sp. TaxID=306 RepID=UPI002607BEE2
GSRVPHGANLLKRCVMVLGRRRPCLPVRLDAALGSINATALLKIGVASCFDMAGVATRLAIR